MVRLLSQINLLRILKRYSMKFCFNGNVSSTSRSPKSYLPSKKFIQKLHIESVKNGYHMKDSGVDIRVIVKTGNDERMGNE
jgi:hypothetical protein